MLFLSRVATVSFSVLEPGNCIKAILGLFSGKTAILDLFSQKELKILPKSDLALMFKVTDHLDKGKGHKNTENVIVALPVRFVVVSFPTVTRTGKPMKYPKRKWVELMCERLVFDVSSFKTSNELFYVIEK